MKDTTLEGRAKTKNGVTRLVFSVVCILLEVIFILLLFTGLNRYAEAINLCTRVLGLIVILNMYASPVTSTIKMPWIFLIMVYSGTVLIIPGIIMQDNSKPNTNLLNLVRYLAIA